MIVSPVLQLTDYITAVASLRDRREGERGAEGMVVENFSVRLHEHSDIQEFLNKVSQHTLMPEFPDGGQHRLCVLSS